MLRRVILISIVAACGSCMEMRETVERVVMVRTTGSDLQPAATGYIYEKKNDGQESVIEMGESEVMAHLSKLYEHPKDFDGVPSSGNYVKEGESNKAHINSEERVIPVQEKQEDPVDGIADVDYKKIFDDYTAKYGDSSAYDEYLKNLKDLKSGHHSKYDGDSAEDDTGYKSNYRYGKEDGGAYLKTKRQSFPSPGSHSEDSDKTYYDHSYYRGSKENKQNAANDQNDDARRFHRIYDNNDNKNDHEYIREGFKAYTDGHKYYGANGKEQNRDGSYGSKYHNGDVGDGGDHSRSSEYKQEDNHSAEKIQGTSHGDGGSQDGHIESKSYGFKIKH